MQKDITSFLDYLTSELNYSDKTIVTYQNELNKYAEFIEMKQIDYLKINKEQVREYLKYLDSLKYKNSSISENLSTMRSFYRYLVIKERIGKNIWASIQNPKREKKIPNYLDEIDMNKMLNFSEEKGIIKDEYTTRDKLIIDLLYDTGCRCDELVHIKLENIDLESQSIKIMGKGSKERIVYFGEITKSDLDAYLPARAIILDGKKSEYLLVAKDGTSITTRRIAQILEKIARLVGIKNKVTPHIIRHTFATHMLNHDSNLRSVQTLMGHSSLSTTQIYTHISNERLRKVYLESHKR